MKIKIPTETLNTLIPIKNKLNFVIGAINSGKSMFCKQLCNKLKYKKLYLIIKDINEWKNVIYKKALTFSQETFFENIKNIHNIEKDSLLIFDDFFNNNKHNNIFYKFINYYISHYQLTVLICIHTIYKNNLFTTILANSNIFLTYSNINQLILKKIDSMYNSFFLHIFNEYREKHPDKYYIYYINIQQNYCIPIVNLLIDSKNIKLNMFKSNKQYYILSKEDNDIYFNKKDNINNTNENKINFINLIKNIYPKSKKIPILAEQLYNFFSDKINNNSNIILNNKNIGNLIDFISTTQNPQTNTNINPKTKQILTYMKKNNMKVPESFIRNKNICKYIC